MGCRGTTVLNCTGLIVECLGEELKARESRHLGDLERKKTGGKKRGKVIKRASFM